MANTALGLLQMHGMDAEAYTAASVKTKSGLSYTQWSERLQEYLAIVEFLFSPDSIVIGGGISADFEQFSPLLHTQAELYQAHYLNQAGVIGSAIYAAQSFRETVHA